LALGKLDLGVLVAWVKLNTLLEISESVLGLQDGGIGYGATEVGLWFVLEAEAQIRHGLT
jgi:hypothetical protein